MPLYGNELDRTTQPYEAGLGRVVKLDKPGDFVGRAALEQGRPGRRPARQLVGLDVTRPRHRPSRLSGATRGRRRRHRRRDQRHAVADPRSARSRWPTWRRPMPNRVRCWTWRFAERRSPPRSSRSRSTSAPPEPTARQPSWPRRFRDADRGGSRSMVPDDLRYTKDHEWVRVEGDEARHRDHRSTPPTSSGTSCSSSCRPWAGRSQQFATFGVVESVKAVSDLFAPVARRGRRASTRRSPASPSS